MKFGMPEIYEYEKTCTDPKVLIIIKLLHEAKRKNAIWCEKVVQLEEKLSQLTSYDEGIHD